jgi:DNA-binding SARP family transcriptional activator
MYRLITLGRLSLERSGAQVPDFLVHRREVAILAILAVEGAVSRDHLMALLWPESDTRWAAALGTMLCAPLS